MSRDPEIYCSDLSRLAGESLFGTATRVSTWFLLEYDDRWDPKAFEKSMLPDEVKTRLSDLVDTLPNARIGLIRQRPRSAPPGLAFYVALIREHHPVLYRFRLSQIEDLLALDLPGLLREDPAYEASRTTDPLYLVCTNGRRDACCARHGVAAYEQMSIYGGANVWQTTHVGGHRFAANVVCLPHGLTYGRVEPERAPAVVEAYRQHRLITDIYRGRTCYDAPVQAADYFLRMQTGITHLDAFRLIDAQPGTSGQWIVRFAAVSADERYTVHLDTEVIATRHSCTDSKPSESTHYRLVNIE